MDAYGLQPRSSEASRRAYSFPVLQTCWTNSGRLHAASEFESGQRIVRMCEGVFVLCVHLSGYCCCVVRLGSLETSLEPGTKQRLLRTAKRYHLGCGLWGQWPFRLVFGNGDGLQADAKCPQHALLSGLQRRCPSLWRYVAELFLSRIVAQTPQAGTCCWCFHSTSPPMFAADAFVGSGDWV